MKKSQLHGKRVTCKINEIEIADARLSVIKDHVYICQNDVLTPCQIADDEFGYKYCSELANEEDMKIAESLSDFNYWYVTDLKFVETRGRKKKEIKSKITNVNMSSKYLTQKEIDSLFEEVKPLASKKALKENYLELTKDNKEQVILILLEEGYKVWEKEGLLYFEKI